MKSIKSIYYHRPTPTQLERTIKWLQSNGYRFISCQELYDCVTNKHPIKEKLVFLSFDDAWQSNLLLIPVLEKYNVPVTIFTPIEPIESGNYWWEFVPKEECEHFKTLGYDEFCGRIENLKQQQKLTRSCMAEDEIICLANHPLVSIQSHTLTHPILTSQPKDLMEKEIKDSKERLENLIGQSVDFFSYPNGSFSKREVECARSVYKMAFTTELRHITRNDDILALPRIEVTGLYFRDKLKFYRVWPVLRKIGCWLLRRK